MGDLIRFPLERRIGETPTAMFCAGCGADRTLPSSCADPGVCPNCGSSARVSVAPLVGNGFTGIRLRSFSGAGVPGVAGGSAGLWQHPH
jgi:hypothetical protein